jgi:hypothetical protein
VRTQIARVTAQRNGRCLAKEIVAAANGFVDMDLRALRIELGARRQAHEKDRQRELLHSAAS